MTTNLPPCDADIIRLFSQRFRGWQDANGSLTIKQPCLQIDAKLQTSITDWLAANSSTDAETFAKYCLLNLDKTNFKLAAQHLSAFLENIGYKIAKNIFKKLKNRQDHHRITPIENSLEEVYQYAWLAASNPQNFYDNFQRETPYLLRYTQRKMEGVIYDGIFAKKNPRMTGYGLLRKLGPRQRKNALELQGYKEPLLSQYCLLWECFYQICTSIRGKISPNDAHWQAIVQQYNRLKNQLPNSMKNHNIDATTVKKYLDDICIPAATMYLFPKFKSIDILHEDNKSPLLELADTSPLPNEILEQQEFQKIINSLRANFSIANILEQLELEQKKVLLLRYGLALTQVEAAQEMSWLDKQNRPINSTVSRCEDRVIVKLLKEISNWVEQEQQNNDYPYTIVPSNTKFNSDWLKKMEIKPAVSSLLSKYYLNLVKSLFDEVLLPVQFNQQQITIQLPQPISNENVLEFVARISELDKDNVLATRLLDLHQLITQQIQTRFNITLQTGGTAAQRIMILVLDWLKIDFDQPNN